MAEVRWIGYPEENESKGISLSPRNQSAAEGISSILGTILGAVEAERKRRRNQELLGRILSAGGMVGQFPTKPQEGPPLPRAQFPTAPQTAPGINQKGSVLGNILGAMLDPRRPPLHPTQLETVLGEKIFERMLEPPKAPTYKVFGGKVYKIDPYTGELTDTGITTEETKDLKDRIMEKVARGEQLTAGEQKIYNDIIKKKKPRDIFDELGLNSNLYAYPSVGTEETETTDKWWLEFK